jgi:hypothetical protein
MSRAAICVLGCLGLVACSPHGGSVGQVESAVTVSIVNPNGGGGEQVDLATCSGGTGALGTQLQITNVSVTAVACSGPAGGTATFSGTLESAATLTFTDAFLVNDDATGSQVAAQLLNVLGPTGNSNHPGTGWTYDSARNVFVLGFSYPLGFPSGTASVQICFAAQGASGDPSKCACTPIEIADVACGTTPGQCLTRGRGFWATHPDVTSSFLPVAACGVAIDTPLAGTCHSSSEALCVAPGREWAGDPQAGQLVAEILAAKLNLAATAANGGDCGADAEALVARCEAQCFADATAIDASGCLGALEAFNEAPSTFTPPPFAAPGPASPQQCQLAKGNGITVAPSCR